MDLALLAALLTGIVLLLVLILLLRIYAFLALLICSIAVGVLAGLNATAIIDTVSRGMGGTLGFVATVIGLGAIFGGILEHSGGAQAITDSLLRTFGQRRASLAMVISGFIIAIPVFFDVAFIILLPVVYALQRRTGRSLLLYAIPLLAGLAITHAFIPPTPGPVAVADIIGADLGWVILLGLLTGIPTALVSGLWFGRRIGRRVFLAAPEVTDAEPSSSPALPPFSLIATIIALPIALILLNTALDSGLLNLKNDSLRNALLLLGHPFSALILANLLAWYSLGIRRGYSRKALQDISSRALKPTGTIILLTGAGGVFKQVLVDTDVGRQLAETLSDVGMPILLFAFLTAAIVRVLQGSATVAMITAAGLVAPLLETAAWSPPQLAALVIAIASGASTLSHVNDSGFWLVSQYLNMDERQTFRSWTMMTLLLSLTGFLVIGLVYLWL